jgi:hypothetical protein
MPCIKMMVMMILIIHMQDNNSANAVFRAAPYTLYQNVINFQNFVTFHDTSVNVISLPAPIFMKLAIISCTALYPLMCAFHYYEFHETLTSQWHWVHNICDRYHLNRSRNVEKRVATHCRRFDFHENSRLTDFL